MKLIDKARFARTPGYIVGIKEGTFVWFYNESLYAWQQWVRQYPALPALRVSACKVKLLKDKWMFTGVIPYLALEDSGLEFDEKGRVFIKFEADWQNWEKWKQSAIERNVRPIKISD